MINDERQILLAILMALLILPACSDEEEVVTKRSAATQAKAKVPAAPRTFDRDGVLARSELEVFESPLPVESYTFNAGRQWAGYKNRHTFSDIVRFYKKNLGSRYETEVMRGGAKMTPKDGDGPEIYIPRPERGGDATSVYYFGTKGEAKPPPIVFEEKSRKASGSRSASAGPSAEKNKNSGAADPEDGGLYRESVVTRPDGSKVTVLRPKNRTSRSGGAGAPKREAKKPRKPFSGTRMIEIPRGTLY